MSGKRTAFKNMSMVGSRFEDVDLASSHFTDVNLARASFVNVSLAGARFSDVDLSNVTIDDANLAGMRINGVPVADLFPACGGDGRTAPAAVEMKAFVPARDFEASTAFYAALGFEIPWSSEDLAYVRHDGTSFLLQRFYVPAHADNFMMHLLVEDADAWHAHVAASGVVERFGVRLSAPEDRPWRIRDFTLTDPSGVLWRIGHNLPVDRADR